MGVHKPGTHGVRSTAADAMKKGGQLSASQTLAFFEKTLDAMRPMRSGVEVTDLLTRARVRLENFGPGLDTKIVITGDSDRFGPRLKGLMQPQGSKLVVTVKDLIQALAVEANTLSIRNANLHKGSEQAAIVGQWKPTNEAMREVRDMLVNFVADDAHYNNDELLTLLGQTTKTVQALTSAEDVGTTVLEVAYAVRVRIPPEVWAKGLSWAPARMSPEFNAHFPVKDGKVIGKNVSEIIDALLLTGERRAFAIDTDGGWAKKQANAAKEKVATPRGRKTPAAGGH